MTPGVLTDGTDASQDIDELLESLKLHEVTRGLPTVLVGVPPGQGGGAVLEALAPHGSVRWGTGQLPSYVSS